MNSHFHLNPAAGVPPRPRARTRPISSRCTLFLVALLPALLAAPAVGCLGVVARADSGTTVQPTPEPSRPPSRSPGEIGRVAVITVKGELDSLEAATMLSERLRLADRETPRLIVIELGARRWRTDLLPDLLASIEACGAPVEVMLLTERGRDTIGLGSLILAQAADYVWVDPRLVVTHEGGWDRQDLAPRDVEWDVALRRLTGALQIILDRREILSQAAGALVHLDRVLSVDDAPAEPGDADAEGPAGSGKAGARRELIVEQVASGRGERLITPRTELVEAEVRISADMLVATGLADGYASKVAEVFARRQLRARPLAREEIEVKIDEKIQSLDAAFEAVREMCYALSATPQRGFGARSEQSVQSDARLVLERCELVRVEINKLEARLNETPEALRTKPSKVERNYIPTDDHADAWAARLKYLRDNVAAHERRALQQLR